MNADDIRSMSAGRELDILVAMNLFGWQWYKWWEDGTVCIFSPEQTSTQGNGMWTRGNVLMPKMVDWEQCGTPLPHYSTDRNDCKVILDWASSHGIYVNIYRDPGPSIFCVCWFRENSGNKVHATDPTNRPRCARPC